MSSNGRIPIYEGKAFIVNPETNYKGRLGSPGRKIFDFVKENPSCTLADIRDAELKIALVNYLVKRNAIKVVDCKKAEAAKGDSAENTSDDS